MTVLGTTCTACGANRRRKTVVYDPQTLLPYCHTPYICNEKHPNSPENLIDRGSQVTLVDYQEAQRLLKIALENDQAIGMEAERIRRMVTQPTSIRINDPELARFLIQIQNEFNFNSVSDAIRYCIELVKENRGRFYADHRELKEQKELQEEAEKVLSTPVAPDEEEITL